MPSLGFRKSLHLLAIIAGVCLLLSTLGGVWQATVASGAASRIYEERTAPTIELMKAVDALHRARQIILIALSEEREEVAEAHLGKLKILDDAMKDALKASAAAVPDQREALAQLELLISEYNKVRDQSVKMIQVGDLPSALGNIKQNAGPKFDKVLLALTDVIQSQANLALKDSQDTSSNLRMRTNTQIVLSLMLLLGMGLIFTLIVRGVFRQLDEMGKTIADVVQRGDFTVSVPVRGKDEIAAVATSFNELVASFRGILKTLNRDVLSVDSTAHELSQNAAASSSSASTTSASASSMAAAVEEMSVGLDQMRDNTTVAIQVVESAAGYSSKGGEVIHEAMKDLEHISNEVRLVADRIVELGDQTQQISSVVALIREVADQTNLLALNAAIEAARAGEQGRGFAVVADEVRKLAERTAGATQEISTMIQNIQNSAAAASDMMKKALSDADAGTSLGHQASAAIERIEKSASEAAGVVRDIANGIAEQSAAGQSIAASVEQVAQAADNSRVIVAKTADAARVLESLSNSIRGQISHFRV